MGVYAKDFIKSEDESGCKWSEEVWFRPFPYCHFLRGSCRGAEKCPLIGVPEPHGRLIDADALWVEIHKICNRHDEGVISDLTCLQQLLSVIRHATTIIPASKEGE